MAILLLWGYGSAEGWWSVFLLPSPSKVLSSAWVVAQNGELFSHVLISLLRIAKGFTLSFVFSLFLACTCGIYPFILKQIEPTLEFLRHIPPMAMIPLLILWFGIGESSKIVIIILATFFPIFLNTTQGIRQCDRKLIEVAASFHYGKADCFRYVILPFAVPYILTGMRLGLGYSWRSLIAAELVAASSGLGYMILDAEQLSRSDVILVGIFVIGFLGSLMDWGVVRLIEYYHGNRGDSDALV